MSNTYLKKARKNIKSLGDNPHAEMLLADLDRLEEDYNNLSSKDYKKKLEKFIKKTDELVPRTMPSLFWDSTRGTLFAVILALLIRGLIVEPFHIPSGSMIPTLLIRDHLFVTKLAYGIRVPFTTLYLMRYDNPKRGDVVVFINPQKPSEDWIKRVVGLPGDVIEVKRNRVHVNGESFKYSDQKVYEILPHGDTQAQRAIYFNEEMAKETNHGILVLGENTYNSNTGPFKVKPEHVFVMGDNRDNSTDSRIIGQIPVNHIIGKALFIWWGGGKNWFNPERIFQEIK